MSEDNFTIELSRRRILAGLATVGAASAAAGAGTMAALSDSEQSTNNTITAGTMNLETKSGGSYGDNDVTLLDTSNIVPGASGKGSVRLRNAPNDDSPENDDSDVGGYLNAMVTGRSYDERGRTEREHEHNDNSGGQGELQKHLEVKTYFVVPWNNTTVVLNDWETLNTAFAGNPFLGGNFALAPGQKVDFCVEWRLPNDAPPTIETDRVVVDFGFDLTQNVVGNLIDGGANSFSSSYPGFPSWTQQKSFDARVITGQQGNWELKVDDTTGNASVGASQPFEFTYDGSTTASITVGGSGGTTLTDSSVPQTDSGTFALVAKSVNGKEASVENVEIDGAPASPSDVATSSDTKGIEFDLGSFGSGVTVTGDLVLEDPSVVGEYGLQIDVL